AGRVPGTHLGTGNVGGQCVSVRARVRRPGTTTRGSGRVRSSEVWCHRGWRGRDPQMMQGSAMVEVHSAPLEFVAPQVTNGRHFRQAWSSAAYMAGSTALLLALWQLASNLIGPAVLPSPWATTQAALGSNPYFWSDIGITSMRILGAFSIGLGAAL